MQAGGEVADGENACCLFLSGALTNRATKGCLRATGGGVSMEDYSPWQLSYPNDMLCSYMHR